MAGLAGKPDSICAVAVPELVPATRGRDMCVQQDRPARKVIVHSRVLPVEVLRTCGPSARGGRTFPSGWRAPSAPANSTGHGRAVNGLNFNMSKNNRNWSAAKALRLEREGLPDSGVVAPEERLFGRDGLAGAVEVEHFAVEPAVFVGHGRASLAAALGVGVGGEGGGPGDIAMAGGIVGVGGFAEGPFGAGMSFTKSEEIGGDILL
jgi:hypothetical protein